MTGAFAGLFVSQEMMVELVVIFLTSTLYMLSETLPEMLTGYLSGHGFTGKTGKRDFMTIRLL